MRRARNTRGWAGAVVGAALAVTVGCAHVHPGDHRPAAAPPIAVPPPGAVPRELDKITMPPYVIEAPDVLQVEVIDYSPQVQVDTKGEPLIDKETGKTITLYQYQGLPVQQVSGQFLVSQSGAVNLGFWGTVTVAGLSVEQAGAAIRQHVVRHPFWTQAKKSPDNVVAILDVAAYNSKQYYVILDGGGSGEQVLRFPITGSETVLDALSNAGGIHAVGSKRNVWVARRCPTAGRPEQILPVDWVGITQHGIGETNYQVLPGDRVYVKAQRLVTFDTALARVITPIERMLGVTLLGAGTVNQISGRGLNNNNGFGN